MSEQTPQNPAPITDLSQLAGLAGPPAAHAHLPPNVVQTTFDDESISTSDFDVFKGRKGHVDRVGILVPRSVVFGRVHFIPEKGYFLCNSTFVTKNGQEIPTRIAQCCEKLDSPRKRFAVPVIHYNTTPDGSLVAPFGYKLKVWRFSEQVYVTLRTSHKEFPLDQHDLLVRCEDEQYQKIQLQSCRESIVNRPDFKQNFGSFIEAFLASLAGKLERTVGKRADAKEWQEIIGAAGSTAAGPSVVSDQPVQDIGELLRG